jgi:HlyD family secretion protein
MNSQSNNAPGGNATATAAGSRPLSLSDRVRSLRLPERSNAPGRRTSWLQWLLCVLLGGSTLFFALRSPGEEKAKDQSRSPTPSPQAGQAADGGEIALTAKGYVIPVHQIQVSPKVSGMIMELFIEEGMRVPADFVLAKLETTEYQAERDRVAAQVEAAKRRLSELTDYRQQEIQQCKAELDDAREQREQLYLDWKRNEDLKGSRAVSAREYELALSAYKSMDFRMEKLKLAYELMQRGPRDERIAAADAELKQYKSELVKAQWKLDNCKVKAPVAGTILTKRAEKGAQVNPSAFSNGLAASLCDMANLAELEVDLTVAERDISKVYKGQKCKISPEAYPERVYEGKVSRLMPTADRGKSSLPIRVRIIVPEGEQLLGVWVPLTPGCMGTTLLGVWVWVPLEGQYLRPDMGAIVTFLGNKK